MTSSFPEQQYNPQAQGGSFRPIEQVDLAPAIQAEQQRQIAPERARLQEIAANDRMRLEDAGRYGKDLQTLSQYSSTLADQMVDYQEEQNDKAMQRGIMKAFTDGVSLEDKAAFKEGEADLQTADTILQKDAADAEANGASVFTGEKIRNLSGWEKYGYYKGKMQIGAQGFPLFIQQNADGGENGEYQIRIGDRVITLNTAKTPEEASAVMSKMVAGYLKPYAGFNPVMVDEYLLTPMRASMQQQMVLFAQKRGAEIKAERKAKRLDDFITTLDIATQLETLPGVDGGPPGQTNYGLLGSQFILAHPNGPSAGRTELAEIIKTGLANGTISPDQADRIVLDTFTYGDGDPKASLLKKNPGVFRFVTQLAEDTRISNNNRENNIEAAEQDQFVKGLIEIATSDDGKVDVEERSAALKAWKNSPYGSRPVPSELSELYTTDDATKDQQRQYLQQISDANGGVIVPQYTIGIDREVLREFKDQVGAGATVASATKTQQDQIKQYLNGVNNELQLYTQGTTSFKSRNAAVQAMNVENKFSKIYAKNARLYNPEEALNQSIIEMDRIVGTIIGPNGAINDDKNIFKKVTSTDEQMYDNRVQAQRALADNPDLVNEALIPGVSTTDLDGALRYLKTGRGDLPYIFKYLAAQYPNLSAIEIAGKQLETTGYKGFKIPQIEIDVTASDNPQVRKLLRYQNTPSRTLRASIEDPELVNVLDQIAGVESEGNGEYDAYNLGGYTADDPIGSGNSAKDGRFGKPISQLTVGEIMSLHRQDKVHAVGRYQFIGPTFKEVVEGLGLPRNTVFDNRVQDAMALYRLRWRINLQNSTTGLINEWTGLKRLSRAQLQQLLQDAQDVLDPYNSPELLLKGL